MIDTLVKILLVTIVMAGVGIAALQIGPLPAPPEWLFEWAKLVTIGWGLLFGTQILRSVISMLGRTNCRAGADSEGR
jgi:hypothetical protein